MIKLNQVKKNLLICAISASTLLSTSAFADPVILPPGEFVTPPPPVFCFKVTGGDNLAGGGARIQFEVLNWTGQAADNLRISQSPLGTGNTGGGFSLTSPAPTNGWYITEAFSNDGGQQIINFSTSASGIQPQPSVSNGTVINPPPIAGIDLDPNNDLDFTDAPAIPNPIDSGINVLDGFILDFPELDVFERVVLQWDLLDIYGFNVDSNFVRNPFSFGTFQIDRASNGSIRVATYFSIGTDLGDVALLYPNGAPALDPVITDQNAITLAPTALATVPVPAAVWLMMSGLAGLITVSRRKKRA